MDRGAWQDAVHGVAKEWDTTERLNSNNKFMYTQNLRKYLGIVFANVIS